MYRSTDAFVERIFDDVVRAIDGETVDRTSLFERLCHLASTNSSTVRDYWGMTEVGRGIPDAAYKTSAPYHFRDSTPARTFYTSGTTAGARGRASYSDRGMELMRLSILASARRRITAGLDRPAVIRLVPPESAAPHMVMAYGMDLIATELGDAALSAVVVGAHGVDLALLQRVLERTTDRGVPAVLLGGSLTYASVCETLERRGVRFALPAGSRVVDAGGFKGAKTAVGAAALRALICRTFGIPDTDVLNLFGMTELASQLYDVSAIAVGPDGARPKGGLAFVEPRVLDPVSEDLLEVGPGVLEVRDLCIIDRPPALLTGDMAVATPAGVAITGRVERGQRRGCSLSLEHLTTRGLAYA